MPTAEARELEQDAVFHRRFMEAREAGFTRLEARVFSESEADIGVLRKLIADGCPAKVAADILN